MAPSSLQSRLFVVDAFTSREDPGLLGNPAGVLISSRPLSDEEAVAAAKKLALPALAVLADPELFTSDVFPNHTELPIAWRSPEGDWLPLCGHATMAASLVLFQLYPNLEQVRYVSRLGRKVQAIRTAHGAEIQFPAAQRPAAVSLLAEEALLSGLEKACKLSRADIAFVGESRSNDPGRVNLLVELVPSVDLAALPVDPTLLVKMPYRGYWLTTPGRQGAPEDMQTRVFFPIIGIPEDQVCGSAHTLFGPYWASKRPGKAGVMEQSVVSRQVSKRGGRVGVRWDGKWGEEDGTCWLAGEGTIIDKGPFALTIQF